MMQISEVEVRKIAKLARIKVSDDEIQRYSLQLTSILSEIEKLQTVETSSVTPMSTVTENNETVTREDEIKYENNIDDIMSNCKNKQYNFYLVPKVVE